MQYAEFIETVWEHYRHHGRDLPWRHEPFDAYHILVSELMLQQTQVSRVVPKYEQFLAVFPSVASLAEAPLSDVIKLWSGLGYNRRAKYLHDAAKQLALKTQAWTAEDLTACKGIGHNTAAAVVTYAYNHAMPFIETNIRTVYIHHFFNDTDQVSDAELMPLVTETLDQESPREWFWALMDYGSYLKAHVGNISRRSKQYARQSTFQGSKRQVRGEVLRTLGQGDYSSDELRSLIIDERLEVVLEDLVKDGLVLHRASRYQLAE